MGQQKKYASMQTRQWIKNWADQAGEELNCERQAAWKTEKAKTEELIKMAQQNIKKD